MLNKTSHKKIILITGVSSGIGKACAEHLSRLGYKIYGTSRNPCGQETAEYTTIQMDLTKSSDIEAAVEKIIKKEKRIDILINNAGIDVCGAIEKLSLDEIRQQFEVNFFGPLQLIQHVLPHMRNQGSGLIINISSIAGLLSIPYEGIYSASKFALEGITEALRMEVKKYGIRAVLIEPGDCCTPITDNRLINKESILDPGYGKEFKNFLQIVASNERNGFNPQKIAELITKIINKKNPDVRYKIGKLEQTSAIPIKRILPSKLFEKIIMLTYKIHAKS